MRILIEARPVPLTREESGVLRVTGTRIPLERVIECHLAGLTPEAIVEAFDTLRIADVYLIIGYYLDHKEEVDAYIQDCEEKAQEIQRRIEQEQPRRVGLREELLARKESRNNPQGRRHTRTTSTA